MGMFKVSAGLLSVMGVIGFGYGQTAPKAPAAAPAAPAPLVLQSLEPSTQADPFPAVKASNFTATSPSVATVDAYLKAVLGYDASRIWRVVAIQNTAAPGVSRVQVLVSERAPNAKVLNASFYVLPDGKHLLADGTGVGAFGANPYADNEAMLKARADGPFRNAPAKDLMLVEFADLQCPSCKAAEPMMARLRTDFPGARFVYQNFPLVEIHPFAYRAAAYGVCVAKSGNDAFFKYAEAVYATQGALTEADGVATLAGAVTKAGGDAAAVAACAETPAAKAQVDASLKLATDLGVNQTPTLAVNGRLLPLANIPYETLKQIIAYQAALDGVTGVAAPSGLSTGPAAK